MSDQLSLFAAKPAARSELPKVPEGWGRGQRPDTVKPLTGLYAGQSMYPGSALATVLGWPPELGAEVFGA